MKGKIHLFIAVVAACCAFSVRCEETEYDETAVVEQEGNQPLFYGDVASEQPAKIYAGPLKATDENELIVVSRDNVQQLIKTLMLAYTHSEDPTMMEVLKSGGLGALRTTFKHLGKEDFGESFLATAQMFIDDLDLEKSEQELLGQFAEEYLEKHKFKIVVPESFLLHEKEMVEFLDMKKKMSKKKGRSMTEPEETAESLELRSVLPYTGKQFSTSIIPGIDLTWIALLGGMLAIPYYFWSDRETQSTARKDVMEEPLPSLAPPRFSLGSGQNEINGRKHPKRRRPNNALTPPPPGPHGGPNKFPKLPPGADPKSLYDKQYRNWYNNHFFQHFNQPPPGVTVPPGGRVFMPPVHPGQNPGNFVSNRPPFPHLQSGIPHLNPVGVTQGAPPNHQALIGAHVQEIIPHPHLQGAGPRVEGNPNHPNQQASPRVEVRPPGAAPHQHHQLHRQNGALLPQGHLQAQETENTQKKQIGVLPQINPSANRREIIGMHAPQPNSIFEENFDILNQKPPPPPPSAPAATNPSPADGQHNIGPGQFVPTHIEDQASGQIRPVDGKSARPTQGHHPDLPLPHQQSAPGQTPGPVPGPITQQVPGQTPGPVIRQIPGQTPGPLIRHVPGQTPGPIPGPGFRQVSGQTPGPIIRQGPGQTLGPIIRQVPGQTPGPIPGPGLRQGPGQLPGPIGHAHPGVSFPPAQRVRWRAHHPLAQPARRHVGVGNPGFIPGRNPGLNHLPQTRIPPTPGLAEAPRLLGGVPRVPGISSAPIGHGFPQEPRIPLLNQPPLPSPNRPTDRAPASALVAPLLPPPPPQGQVGSGEDNQSFGAFKPEREGNTHFKVSFEAGDGNEIQAETEGEKPQDIANDSQAQESVKSGTTFVIVHPPNSVPAEPSKQGNILDLSKSQWQKVPDQQARHQQVLSHTKPLVVTIGNEQQVNAQQQAQQHEQQQQQQAAWQRQKQEKQHQALQEAKKQHEEQQQERETLIRQQKDREIKEQHEKERREQQRQWELEQQKQQQMEKQRWQEQQKRELQQQQKEQETLTAQALTHARPQHSISQEQFQSLIREQQQESQSQSQEGLARQEGAQSSNSEDGSRFASSQDSRTSGETPRQPQKPLHIQHFLQQQEQRHKEYLKLQQQESAKRHLGEVSKENAFSSADKSGSFYKEEKGGFVPIYGPPTPPHGLVIRPTTERYELPKPSAFLDKLKAEQEKVTSNLHIVEGERVPVFSSMESGEPDKTSNLEIARAEAIKFSAENFESAAKEFLADSSNKVEVSTSPQASTQPPPAPTQPPPAPTQRSPAPTQRPPAPTQRPKFTPTQPPKFTPTEVPPAIFVQKPTSRTGVPLIVTPERPTKYRVVTSKSVVTSVPVSLSQKYPSAYNIYKADKESSTPTSTQEVDEVYNDLFERRADGNSPAVDQGPDNTGGVFSSLEELMPNYEQDYRQVLRGYQRKQLGAEDQQVVYDQVVEASEQLEDYVPPTQSKEQRPPQSREEIASQSGDGAQSKEVLRQNAAGFVNNNEDGSVHEDNDVIDNNDNNFDVNRRLQTEPVSSETVPAEGSQEPGKNRNSKTNENIPVYSLDPFYGPRLSRIDAIFFQMKLDEDQEGCREQVVCNMYKNPDVYTPLSDFLSRQLTVTLEELQKPQVADERILRFFRYLQAARTGQDGGDCLAKYAGCQQDTTRLAHKPILDAFHKVSDLMSHEKV